MLWPREEFHAAYGQIKHDALQSGGSSVLVLVALDVDALCASAILTSLLKADFVSYALLPVRGYEDIVRIRDARIATSSSTSELRSIVMINCGAIVNVMQLLQLPPTVKCYIFDSHRPIHLANIYDANQQIVLFDDGAQSIEEFPEDGSDIERDEMEDASDTDGEEDEDEEEEEEEEVEDIDEDEGEAEVEFGESTEHAKDTDETEDVAAVDVAMSPSGGAEENDKNKRKREEDVREEGDQDDDAHDPVDEDDADADVNMVSPKKHKPDGVHVEEIEDTVATASTDKMAKRNRREQILRYYRGSFQGAPAASIAYELAQQMNAGSNRDLLWFAIVGLTKQFIMEEIDADNYILMVHRFQDEVLGLDASAPGSTGVDEDQTIANPAYEHGRITFEEEYRFMCYRHWSLYEAMYYSDYVAAKLGLYMDQARRFGARNAASADGSDGETTLHVFLARMGFSLRQSQQKFTYMPLEMKHQLRNKIQEIAPEFGLDDVFYGSFKRQFAFQYLLGAADAVHGLHALLEAPEAYISSVFQAENHHQKGVLQQPLHSAFQIDSKGITPISTNEGDAAETEKVEDLRDFKHQNFFLASTALSCRSVASSALMESGIKVAMELKQAIVRVGISIMERKLIVRVKHFRYICLTIPEREQELFANPNVLTQLALFLLTVHRASGKWGGLPPSKKKKTRGDGDDEDGDDDAEEVTQQKPIVPLVLITRNPVQNCFLVVGITCPTNPGEVHRNTLGTAFRLAAGETGANFRQDGFSSAVLEIQMDDIQYFVEQLHNVMDA